MIQSDDSLLQELIPRSSAAVICHARVVSRDYAPLPPSLLYIPIRPHLYLLKELYSHIFV